MCVVAKLLRGVCSCGLLIFKMSSKKKSSLKVLVAFLASVEGWHAFLFCIISCKLRSSSTTTTRTRTYRLYNQQPSTFISFEYYVFVPSHSVNLKGERQQKYTNRTENHETTQKVLLAVHPASGAHGTNHRGRTISQTSTSSSRRRSIRYRHRWITFTRASNVISDNEFVPNS